MSQCRKINSENKGQTQPSPSIAVNRESNNNIKSLEWILPLETEGNTPNIFYRKNPCLWSPMNNILSGTATRFNEPMKDEQICMTICEQAGRKPIHEIFMNIDWWTDSKSSKDHLSRKTTFSWHLSWCGWSLVTSTMTPPHQYIFMTVQWIIIWADYTAGILFTMTQWNAPTKQGQTAVWHKPQIGKKN